MPQYSTSAAIQTDYLSQTDNLVAGATYKGRLNTDVDDPTCGDMTLLVAGVFVFTCTSATNAESWRVDIDGAQRTFTTAGTVGATATALKAAIDYLKAPGRALEGKVASTAVNAGAVTVTLVAGYVPSNIELVAPGGAASTFTEAYSTSPSAPVDHLPGLWVARDLSAHDPQLTRVKRPGSTSDKPYGIAVLEGALAATADDEVGDVLAHWPSGRAMTVARRRDGGLMGLADGAIVAADVGKIVYMVVTGTRRGYSRKDDGGTAEVKTATVTYDNGSATGFTIDGVDHTITVDAATSATATGAALAAKAAADAQFNLLYTVSAAAGVLTVIKRLSGAFTMTKVVGGAADLTIATTVEGVEPVAVATTSTFMAPAADGAPVAVNVQQAT